MDTAVKYKTCEDEDFQVFTKYLLYLYVAGILWVHGIFFTFFCKSVLDEIFI